MELTDIIIFSLKFFSLLSVIVVAISYFVFKVKDRKRVKPYMRQEAVEPQAIRVQYEEAENNNRFQILNDTGTGQSNEQYNGGREIAFERPQAVNFYNERPGQSFRRENSAGYYNNVYDRYSANAYEPMHKVKL